MIERRLYNQPMKYLAWVLILTVCLVVGCSESIDQQIRAAVDAIVDGKPVCLPSGEDGFPVTYGSRERYKHKRLGSFVQAGLLTASDVGEGSVLYDFTEVGRAAFQEGESIIGTFLGFCYAETKVLEIVGWRVLLDRTVVEFTYETVGFADWSEREGVAELFKKLSKDLANRGVRSTGTVPLIKTNKGWRSL